MFLLLCKSISGVNFIFGAKFLKQSLSTYFRSVGYEVVVRKGLSRNICNLDSYLSVQPTMYVGR